MKSFFRETGPWLALLLLTDLTYILLTWLLRPEAIGSVSLFIILFSLLVTGTGYAVQRRRKRRMLLAAMRFLEDPAENAKAELLAAADASWVPVINAASALLQKQKNDLNEKKMELLNYQEFIEAWTHEIKTPLSLMTLVLDNHTDELSPYVAERMAHARQQISGDVDRILYYARLQAGHKDYNFTRFRVDECADEVLTDFAPIAEERHVVFRTDMSPAEVVSDRKVFVFMLSQLVGNAIKYSDPENGLVMVSVRQDGTEQKICLAVYDNGPGVPPEDLPFIFDKGFTGNHPDRQKATGMGLYLVSRYAEAMAAEVQPVGGLPESFGFGIELIFPIVG